MATIELTNEQTLDLMAQVGNLADTVGLDDPEALNAEMMQILEEAMGESPKRRYDFCQGVVAVTGLNWNAVLTQKPPGLVKLCRDFVRDGAVNDVPSAAVPKRAPKKPEAKKDNGVGENTPEPPKETKPKRTPKKKDPAPAPETPPEEPPKPAARKSLKRKPQTTAPPESSPETEQKPAPNPVTASSDITLEDVHGALLQLGERVAQLETTIEGAEMHNKDFIGDEMGSIRDLLQEFWGYQRRMISEESYIPPEKLGG